MFKRLKGYFKIEYILLFLAAFELLNKHHFVLFGLFAWLFIKGKIKRSALNKDFMWVLLWGISYLFFGTYNFSVLHIPALLCAAIIGYSMTSDQDSVFKLILIIAVGYGLEGILMFFAGGEVTFAEDNATRTVTSIWGGERALTAQDTILYLFSGVIVYIMADREIKWSWKLLSLVFELFVVYGSLRTASRSPIVFCPIIIFVSFWAYNSQQIKLRTLFTSILLLFAILVLYESNLFGIKSVVEDSYLFSRFTNQDDGGVVENSRFRLQSHFSDVWLYDLWGGLYDKIGYYFHNTWLDMYSFSGVFGFITFIGVTIRFLMNFIFVFKRTDVKERSIWAGALVAFMLPMFFEPLYWGAPAYFAFYFIIYGMLSKRCFVLA